MGGVGASGVPVLLQAEIGQPCPRAHGPVTTPKWAPSGLTVTEAATQSCELPSSGKGTGAVSYHMLGTSSCLSSLPSFFR